MLARVALRVPRRCAVVVAMSRIVTLGQAHAITLVLRTSAVLSACVTACMCMCLRCHVDDGVQDLQNKNMSITR